MRVIKLHILFFITIVLLNSCVEKYFLDENNVIVSNVVVDALISNSSDTQIVKLSMSSTPEKPMFIPLSNCFVKVMSDDGKEFIFKESDMIPGSYEGVIDEKYLDVGSKLKLDFITESGKEYESEYEEFIVCPPVDSVYYKVEHKPTNDPNIITDGLQFYLNLSSSNENGYYYFWQIDETWEYHSTWPIKMYYDGILHNGAIDYSLYYCYKTVPVSEIFLLNTESLEQNSFKQLPLHFVDNLTQRLMYKYSILVKQYAISKSTYSFLKNLKKNSYESGGLFDSQPVMVQGNVYNSKNPDEIVLGNFGVATMKSKRIILENVEGLSFNDVPVCGAVKLEESLRRFSWLDWPIYLVYMPDVDGSMVIGIAKSDCVDCTLKGGTTQKPEWW